METMPGLGEPPKAVGTGEAEEEETGRWASAKLPPGLLLGVA